MQGPFCTVQPGWSGGFKYPSYLHRYGQLQAAWTLLGRSVLLQDIHCVLRSVEHAGAASSLDASPPGLQVVGSAAWLPSTHPPNLRWSSDTEKLKPLKCALPLRGAACNGRPPRQPLLEVAQ